MMVTGKGKQRKRSRPNWEFLMTDVCGRDRPSLRRAAAWVNSLCIPALQPSLDAPAIGRVRLRRRDSADHNQQKGMTDEFLRGFTLHLFSHALGPHAPFRLSRRPTALSCCQGASPLEHSSPASPPNSRWRSRAAGSRMQIAVALGPCASNSSFVQVIATLTAKTARRKRASNLAGSDAGEVSTTGK